MKIEEEKTGKEERGRLKDRRERDRGMNRKSENEEDREKRKKRGEKGRKREEIKT